jgi:hypothetical protein
VLYCPTAGSGISAQNEDCKLSVTGYYITIMHRATFPKAFTYMVATYDLDVCV